MGERLKGDPSASGLNIQHSHSAHPAPESAGEGTAREWELLAQAWIKARRARDKALGSKLFSDPAWAILLDLYVSFCERRKVSVSDIALISAAPLTTALRWLQLLESEGLVCRAADSQDGRRVNIMLTPVGREKMECALAGAAASDQRLGLQRLRLVE